MNEIMISLDLLANNNLAPSFIIATIACNSTIMNLAAWLSVQNILPTS